MSIPNPMQKSTQPPGVHGAALVLIRDRAERLGVELPASEYASTEHVRAALGIVQDLIDVVAQLTDHDRTPAVIA